MIDPADAPEGFEAVERGVLEDLENWLEDEIHGAWSHDQDTREGALLSVVRKIKKLRIKKLRKEAKR